MSRRRTSPLLLGDDPLDGVFDADVRLRPMRPARLVPSKSPELLYAEIERASQVWGGGGHPILAVSPTGLDREEIRRIEIAEVDSLGGETAVSMPLVCDRLPIGRPICFPVIPVLARKDRSYYKKVTVPRLSAEDPWRLVYAAVLGTCPDEIDAELVALYSMRDGLTYNQFIRVETEEVEGSVEDLLRRLGPERLTPRDASMSALAAGRGLATGLMDRQEVLPADKFKRQAAGPNIVVICSETDASDCALLWTLRGVHGSAYDFPLGLPSSQASGDMLALLAGEGRNASFGFVGGPLYLTSTTVPHSELQRLAEAANRGIEVASPTELFDLGSAPGRWSKRVLTFSRGRSLVVPVTEQDRELVQDIDKLFYKPAFRLDVSMVESPLPVDITLRGPGDGGPSYPAGRAQLRVDDELTAQSLVWPTGWVVVRALAQTRGLEVGVSDAGRAAMALAGAAGGLEGLNWLADRELLGLLRRMSEASGASLTRSRLARHLGSSAQAEDLLVSEGLVTAPSGEGRAFRFNEFARVLGRPGATSWLRWAEHRRLVVRGVQVKCSRCGADGDCSGPRPRVVIG